MNKTLKHIFLSTFLLISMTALAQTNHVTVRGNVFGGGNLANVGGKSTVLIDQAGAEIQKDVYCGGALADVDTINKNQLNTVTLTQGTVIQDIYGGGLGDATHPAKVFGPVQVNINGGQARNVFGCNNINGAPQSTVRVDINTCDTIGAVYGGGNQAAYSYNKPLVFVHNCTNKIGSVFGSGNQATVPGTDVTIYGGIIGDVYGGGNQAGVTTSGTTVKIYGGTIDRVFAGNNEDGTITGPMSVTVDKQTEAGHSSCEMHMGELYGGGNAVAGPAGTLSVLCTGGNTEGIGKVFGGANAANITGDIILTLSQGRITDGIYGGNNSSGTVEGNITLSLQGAAECNYPFPIVFGGGYGESTATNGNVAVTVGSTEGANQPTMSSDIYGGSAFGSVNNEATDETTVNILNGTVNGNVYGGGLGEEGNATKGTVNGIVTVNIGAVDNTNPSNPVYSGNASFANTSEIYGCNNSGGSPKADVFVNIYKTKHITANSYPADLAALSAPTDEVDLNDLAVLIADPDDPSYPSKFALAAVYGGGNKASYIPSVSGKSTTVHVYDCSENTIRTIYGGGNAANVGSTGPGAITANTNVILDGGFIDRVFGGGNGYSSTNNHDKPYYDAGEDECTTTDTGEPCPDYNPGANIYGTASTVVHGGLYRQIFGGNNQYGDATAVNLTFNDQNSCPLLIHESFGGANEADITGDVTTNLDCSELQIGNFYGGSNLADIINGSVTLNVYGGTYTNVFGGSKGRLANNTAVPPIPAKSADISGDVTLNLFGGTMTNAFGGSDVLGGISGKITVNVLDYGTTNCGLNVQNIYGGGQDAAYSPTTTGAYPEVNIIHGSIGGNVFGGGLGVDAVVTSNPVVNIGYDATSMGDPNTNPSLIYNLTHNPDPAITYTLPNSIYNAGTATFTPSNLQATVGGNVYGGGDLAAVDGNTSVTIQKSNSSAANIFGGGNQAGISGGTTVDIFGGLVSAGVYGGCNTSGTVGGAIAVNVKGDLGTSLSPLTAGVYGGGKGSDTETSGDVTVTIGDGATPSIYADVYGGSALGKVNSSSVSPANLTKVEFKNGTLYGNLYGGGMGDNTNEALVYGNVQVDITNGNIKGNNTDPGVYGGCNVKGTVYGMVTVNVNGGTVGTDADHKANIYGGGLGANTNVKGSMAMTVGNAVGDAGAIIWGDVYGGSAKGLVNCTFTGSEPGLTPGAQTDVTLNAGTINGSLYGGGHGIGGANANVWGPVAVEVNGGKVSGAVYGCNNAAGAPQGTVSVDIYGTDMPLSGYALGNVFGGGNLAGYTGTPDVTIHNCDNSIEYVYGGGNAAPVAATNVKVYGGNTIGNVFGGGNGTGVAPDFVMVTGNVLANIYGGTIGKVFGGNNSSGLIHGTVTLNVNKATESGHSPCDMKIGEVYGGGNEAAGNAGAISIGCTGTWTTGHDSHNSTNNRIGYELEGIGAVYGGANKADIGTSSVHSDITVDINSGIIDTVFGGNNTNGDIYGTITVNINKDNTSACASNWYVGHVFGGGNHAAYTGVPDVNIQNGTVSGCVYGGGNEAGVGGGDVAMTGGEVLGGIYGGCNTSGIVDGDITVSVTAGTVGANDGIKTDGVYGGGYGNGTSTTGDVEVSIAGSGVNVYGDVYGGSAKGSVNTDNNNTTTVTLTNGSVHGDLYGGGLGDNTYAAAVNGAVTVNVNGGTVTDVYGCNNVNGAPQDAVTVNINSNVGGNVYGGGNQAYYGGTPDVNIIAGTVSGKVFGGGNNITADAELTPYGVANSHVDMTGGTVMGGVYGGCNEKGTVIGNSEVNITGGTIGTSANYSLATPVTTDVFGGGLGENTRVKGDVTVNFGTATSAATGHTALPEIFGDIYGGSARGSVNTDNTNTTTVNILNGTLKSHKEEAPSHTVNDQIYYLYTGGNVFGGGLGQAGDGNVDKGKVYGKVVVNIGAHSRSRELHPESDDNIGQASIEGNVYGCNNTNGSPQDDVTVNIYRTYMMEKDTITYTSADATYAIDNVFGGGNKANYTATDKTATVNILGCYNTIERVFGGGNAAAAPNVHTNIQGGRFATVFGGGNGEVQPANITGNVNLEIHGGIIGESFIGSNEQGSISGTTSATIDESSGCDEILITEFYCGGKYANFTGNINATITCSQNMQVTNLYGGCKEAHVLGNIHLTVNGGTFENVYGGSKGTTEKGADIEGNILLEIFGGTVTNAIFGGSNIQGAIGGTITVNVEQKTGADYCPLDVSTADVYGGGNKADYPGTPASDSPLSGTITHSSPYNYPAVNIKNATVRNVFGGGLQADVEGDPQIMIKKGSKITGNVYGGGNMGEVDGNPTVIINGLLDD